MRLTPDKKLSIVITAIKHKKSVIDLAIENKIARKTIYSWIKKYKFASKRNKRTSLEDKYVKAVNHPRYSQNFLKRKIIRIVKRNPKLSINEISKAINANHHAVYNTLKALNLTTQNSRLGFCNIYKFPGILEKEVKQSVINSVINKDKSITSLAKEYNLARKTIYKWLSDYKEKGNADTNYIKGLSHPKSYSQGQINTILNEVAVSPTSSIHNLARSLNLSSHGVFNILKKYNLTHSFQRVAYAASKSEAKAPESSFVNSTIKSILSWFSPNMLPAPPPSGKNLHKYFGVSFFLSSALSLAAIYWFKLLFISSTGPVQSIGYIFAGLALLMGSFFFLYSLKYYLTLVIVLSFSQQDEINKNRKFFNGGFLSRILGSKTATNTIRQQTSLTAPGLEPNLDHITLKSHPFISIHIPFYNEKNVVERAIRAAANFKYAGNYEIILCDDSTDETSEIIRNYQKDCLFKNEALKEIKGEGWSLTEVEVRPGVILKHLHRTSREGYKGKALDLALKLTDPKAEYISVFDADFVPYPDTLDLFLKYFQISEINTNTTGSPINTSSQLGIGDHLKFGIGNSRVAAVQGYQWHVLNKSENWITRGVRSEYAGSYVVERSGAEIYGGIKQISGSVYMIKRKVLAEIGWGTSITEDFELTLKLYDKGYKVIYTPYVQAPAECVSTVKRLVRQRMRWAEGHSFNIKKMFRSLITNPKISISEKLELLYLSPYYLQAFFFLCGTLAWVISETVFRVRLPFWTELWGWSLVLTNMIALPLLNSVGLFLEESEEKDYAGIGSFLALSYLLVPFQAYAAVKGFLEKKEGPWFRTPKTGRITDIFARGRFYRFISDILPGLGGRTDKNLENKTGSAQSPYLSFITANNRFQNFNIKPTRVRWFGKAILSVLLIITTSFLYLSHGVTTVYATNMAGPLKLGLGNDGAGGTWPTWGNFMQNTTSYSSGVAFRLQSSFAGTGTNNWTWYTRMLPTGGGDGSIPSGAYYLQMAKYNGRAVTDVYNFGVQLLLTNNNGIARTQLLGGAFQIRPTNANNTLFQYSLGSLGSAQPVASANPNRLSLRIFWINGSNSSGWVNLVINNGTVPARLILPGDITVPEVSKIMVMAIVMVIIPIAPAVVEGRYRRKKMDLIQESIDAWKALLNKLFGDETEKYLDDLPV